MTPPSLPTVQRGEESSSEKTRVRYGRNMEICYFGFLFIVLLATSLHAKAPDIGPVPALQFTPVAPKRLTLQNGVVVYLLEDHELPLLNLSLKMKVSPADEPTDLRGSMALMGSVWRSGGTKSRPPEKLNEELEYRAAHIETSAGEESAAISLSCLIKDEAQALEIFKDVLFNPEFDEDQILLAKAKIIESIKRKNDDPWNIGRRAFRDVTYGSTHFYAWNPTEELVNRINRLHLKDLHQKVVTPDNAILTVVGDFKQDRFLQTLNQLLGEWKPQGRVIPSYDYALINPPAERVYFVEKDLTQSLIYVGGLGLTRLSPDQYAMAVDNYILGDGGTSRLFGNIRSRMGLAYAVGSFYTAPKGPGVAGAACQTKSISTAVVLRALQNEMAGLKKTPFTPEEINLAKNALVQSFVFRFDSLAQIAQEQADLEFYGLPSDYLKTYTKKIEALTPADLNGVAEKYFNPERMKVVVIGSKEKIGESFKELGPLTEIPLESIP